jgi:autophagy-related protein 18
MRLASKTNPLTTRWNPNIVSVSLNQDSSCVSTGSQRGFSVCQLSPFHRHIFSMKGGIGVCEMLDCSSLVAVVGGGNSPAFSSRRLRVFNTSSSTTICEMNFDYPIIAVHLNHRCMIVVLATQVHIFNVDTMKQTQRLDTPNNPRGLCTLQHIADSSSTSVLLCFPGAVEKGDVFIFNVATQKSVTVIEAHQSPLQALVLSSNGRYLATASSKGTLIRIFDLNKGNENVATFRRGVTTSVVTTMRFNKDNSLLCVGSKNGTVHVFDVNAVLDPDHSITLASRAAEASTSTASTAKAAAKTLLSGLMDTLPTALSSQRSSCSVSIEPDLAFICGFLSMTKPAAIRNTNGEEVKTSTDNNNNNANQYDALVVVTSTGIVSIHQMNFVDGTTTLEAQEFLVVGENQQQSKLPPATTTTQ